MAAVKIKMLLWLNLIATVCVFIQPISAEKTLFFGKLVTL